MDYRLAKTMKLLGQFIRTNNESNLGIITGDPQINST